MSKHLFAEDDKNSIKTGLDFLFQPEKSSAKVPIRWKQFLVTWSAIYPLSMLIPIFGLPPLKFMNLPENKFLSSFFVSGLIVCIMLNFLMPYYIKLIPKLLYN